MVFELFVDDILEYSRTKDKAKLVQSCEKKYLDEMNRLKRAPNCNPVGVAAVNIYMTGMYDLAELYDKADALFFQTADLLKRNRETTAYVELHLIRVESMIVHKRFELARRLLDAILDKIGSCSDDKRQRFADLSSKLMAASDGEEAPG